jgi:hypothetical protein
MSYKHISSKVVFNKNGKRKHARIFTDGYGVYQEDNYENKFYTNISEEKYRKNMINSGYEIRFEYLNLKDYSTRIQWIKWSK